VQQLPLLAGVEIVERPYKDVRLVSKQIIRELRDSGYVKRSGRRVLIALEIYRNRYQQWPTPAELTRFMFEQKWIPREDRNCVSPRLTELIHGYDVRLKDGTVKHIDGGALDQLPLRVCAVTGQKAHPVSIREIGSSERRVA
jgi:hypothetical protein